MLRASKPEGRTYQGGLPDFIIHIVRSVITGQQDSSPAFAKHIASWKLESLSRPRTHPAQTSGSLESSAMCQSSMVDAQQLLRNEEKVS